jgi:hypothetical protein
MTKDEALKLALHELEGIPVYKKYGVRISNAITAIKEALALTSTQYEEQPAQESVESLYNPNPVEYQYHYPDGSWRCSNGEVINGMHPDKARSLYALKDNT